MKWVTRKERKNLRRERAKEWHRYFVWAKPVTIYRAKHCDMIVPEHRVWMAYVERRWNVDKCQPVEHGFWEYRTARTS
jgi:hypothetical protein